MSQCVVVYNMFTVYVCVSTLSQRGGKMGPGRLTLKEFAAFFKDHFADQYMVIYTYRFNTCSSMSTLTVVHAAV